MRIIAATNRDLNAEQGSGCFRVDLYHRLSVDPVHIPPLRERVEDTALLAGHVLNVKGCGLAAVVHASMLPPVPL